MAKQLDPACAAFQAAIQLLGRPWTALILGVLQQGPLRFSELAERAHGVGTKILSSRLKDLETRGLILRRVDGGPPVRVLYSLTRKGMAFGEVARAIQLWGRELIDAPLHPVKRGARQSARA